MLYLELNKNISGDIFRVMYTLQVLHHSMVCDINITNKHRLLAEPRPGGLRRHKMRFANEP